MKVIVLHTQDVPHSQGNISPDKRPPVPGPSVLSLVSDSPCSSTNQVSGFQRRLCMVIHGCQTGLHGERVEKGRERGRSHMGLEGQV